MKPKMIKTGLLPHQGATSLRIVHLIRKTGKKDTLVELIGETYNAEPILYRNEQLSANKALSRYLTMMKEFSE